MSLTPLDVDKAVFRKAFLGGYNRADVEQFLAEISRSLEGYLGDIATLSSKVVQLEAELGRYKDNEQVLRNSNALAQRTADELVSAARERAVGIKREAELEADQLKHSLDDLRAERETFERSFLSMLSEFLDKLQATDSPASDRVGARLAATAAQLTPSDGAGPVLELATPELTAPAPIPTRFDVIPEAPRITLQPGVAPRTPLAPEPSRADLIDMLSGKPGAYPGGLDSDAAELERILANAQPTQAPAIAQYDQPAEA